MVRLFISQHLCSVFYVVLRPKLINDQSLRHLLVVLIARILMNIAIFITQFFNFLNYFLNIFFIKYVSLTYNIFFTIYSEPRKGDQERSGRGWQHRQQDRGCTDKGHQGHSQPVNQ